MPQPPIRTPGLSVFFPAYNDGGTMASLVITARQTASRLRCDFEDYGKSQLFNFRRVIKTAVDVAQPCIALVVRQEHRRQGVPANVLPPPPGNHA